MNSRNLKSALWSLLLSCSVLVGCGGGGNGSPSTPPPSSPSTPSSPSQGGITTTALKDAALGVYYSESVTSSGMGNSPTWSLASGILPPGLTVAGGCCAPATVIQGTPTQLGTSTFSLSVSNGTQTVSRSFTLKVVPNEVAISTTSLPSGDTATPYVQFIEAVRGEPGRTWSIVEGSLPPGLELTGSNSALLAGLPRKAGVFPFTVQVSDGKSTARARLSVTIAQAPLSITNSQGTPRDGIIGDHYSYSLMALGGSGDKTWSISSGTLPPGVSLNASTGELSGTLTQTGTFSFTARVNDETGSNAADYTVRVFNRLKITSTSLPGGSVNTPYSVQLQCTGGTGPYTWSTSYVLPPGITLSPDGLLQGTPGLPWKIEKFRLSVQDSSSLKQWAYLESPLTIDGPMVITTKSLPPAVAGALYYPMPLQVYGGVAPYHWSVSAGSLPPWLVLNVATGQLRGTPPAYSGNLSFTVRVTDASATPQSATQDLAILSRNSFGRNDSLQAATFINNTLAITGSIDPIRGIISPYEDGPDQDYYRLVSLSNRTLRLSASATSMVPVIEILDESGQRFQTCGAESREPCVLDYHANKDATMSFKVPGNSETVFYLHVLDYFGDARPDLNYILYLNGY